MTNEMFVRMILTFVSMLSALITVFVVPYLKSKINADQMNQVLGYVQVAVRCAEQIYTQEEWKQKKAYVFDCTKEYVNKILNISLDDSDLDLIIEGIVNEIKHGGSE